MGNDEARKLDSIDSRSSVESVLHTRLRIGKRDTGA